MEARVVALYNAKQNAAREVELGNVELVGTVRGPFCVNARTLPATFEFRSAGLQRDADSREDGSKIAAEATIADPCLWSAELPHVYQVEVEAREADRVLAAFRGEIGLRRTTPRRPYDFSAE